MILDHFPSYMRDQLTAVEFIWTPGNGAPAVWIAGIFVCHGTFPSAAMLAYDHNAHLMPLQPIWNRGDSGLFSVFRP
eukprot:8192833-Karenia_brevis.AAC.1